MPLMPEPRIKIDALILDMDGVLADTEPLHVKAWDVTLREIDSAIVVRERSRLAGMSSTQIGEELIRIFKLSIGVDELVARKREIYRAMIVNGLEPFPGLAEELARWKDGRLSLVTSSTGWEAAMLLGHFGFEGWFNPVITCDDVQKAKPAPDSYLLAIKRLGVPASGCVVIEDSSNGIQAAQAAGARVAAVTTTHPHERVTGALGVFPSTVEALRWLRS
jgi:HAD superfamily hydrolase (TIGR01509 family)